MSNPTEVEQLVLPPVSVLIGHLPGLRIHTDPYTGPFEAYHHHATGAQTWDLDAIATVARAHAGPVLDIGCGRGRLALALAREGHQVTAVDTSAPALAHLRRIVASEPGLTEHVEILHGDVADPAVVPEARFSVAALADLSINIFAAPRSLEQLFAAVGRVLTPSGVFCLAVLTDEAVGYYERLRGMTAVPFPDDEGRQRLLWMVMHHDPAGPYFQRTYFAQDSNAADGSVAGDVTAVRERLWTPDTLQPHAEVAGFVLEDTRPLEIDTLHGPLPAALLTFGHADARS